MMIIDTKNDRSRQRWHEVKQFARATGLAGQLASMLRRLHNMSRGRLCVIYRDIAPLSLSFTIVYTAFDGVTQRGYNGGLIFQSDDMPADGSAPSYTVSLATGTGWFIHT